MLTTEEGSSNVKPHNIPQKSVMVASPVNRVRQTSFNKSPKFLGISANANTSGSIIKEENKPSSKLRQILSQPAENTRSALLLKNNPSISSLVTTSTQPAMTNTNSNQIVDQNNVSNTELNAAMINTKKKIMKLKRFGQILKNATVEKKPKHIAEGGGQVFSETEDNIHGIIDAKEASHKIAKIVKELPNLIKF